MVPELPAGVSLVRVAGRGACPVADLGESGRDGALLAVDNVCRGVGTMEIPLGIMTSVVGAPVFILLLARARAAWF